MSWIPLVCIAIMSTSMRMYVIILNIVSTIKSDLFYNFLNITDASGKKVVSYKSCMLLL